MCRSLAGLKARCGRRHDEGISSRKLTFVTATPWHLSWPWAVQYAILDVNQNLISMKRWLISGVFILFFAGWSGAQSLDDVITSGSYLGPMVEIGEINGEVGLSLGLAGGVDFRRFSIGFFGMRTQDRYAHTLGNDEYRVQLTYGGLWGQISHQATEQFRLLGSLRTGWGEAALSWDNNPPGAGSPRDELWLTVPEFGFEIILNPYVSVTMTSGVRICTGAEGIAGIENRDITSLINAITIRLGRRR